MASPRTALVSSPDPLTRIAALAARVMAAPVAMVARWNGEPLREDLDGFRFESVFGATPSYVQSKLGLLDQQAWLDFAQLDSCVFPDGNGGLSSFAGKALRDGNGNILGLLAVLDDHARVVRPGELRQLSDLASLATKEIARESADPDRGRAQDELIDKTALLAKFSEDLRHLHRLSTTTYDSLEDLFADYLDTGREIFGLPNGMVIQARGRYAVVRGVRSDLAPLRSGQTLLLSDLLCGEAVRLRRTLAAAAGGKMGLECYLGSPIVVNDEVFGVMSFSSSLPRFRGFTAHEIEIIELMAKGIARSVLENQMRSERRRAEVLEADRNAVLEMVAKNEALDSTLLQLVRMVERQSPSLNGAVVLMREGQLFCAAAPGMPPEYQKRLQGLPMMNVPGCCFSAAYERETIVFDGATPHCGDDGPAACIHEFCWQAAGAAPILSGSGEVLGIFSTYYRLAQQPRRVDAELLAMAARLAAIAIEQRIMTDQLAFQARHDTLTGLANRMRFSELLERKISGAQPADRPFAVMFVDLDRFKQVNDRLGHSAGDALLRHVASRLKSCLLAGESAARLGGDEFAALLDRFDSPEEAIVRSQQFLEALRAPVSINGNELFVTASVGLSLYPRDARNAAELLARADLAMYRVKNHGKNDVLSFTPALDRGSERLEIEHSLRRALERNEFRLVYQPQVELDGSLAGLEALLVWQHPQMGRIPPSTFIPVAEENHMIIPIGAWVLRQACLRNAEWQRAGYPPVKVAVNVSPLQFTRVDFVETVAGALRETGLHPCYLELEITENLIMQDLPESVGQILRLRELGISISIDDFGTGYSSLSYLQQLPVDTLKIDQSFLRGAEQKSTMSVIQTIVSLAHNFGLLVVAEGVETPRHLELLRGVGCDKAQGHLFGEPLEAEAVEQLLAEGERAQGGAC